MESLSEPTAAALVGYAIGFIIGVVLTASVATYLVS